MRTTHLLTAAFAASLMYIAPAAVAAPPTNGPPGNNGTVKIAGEGADPRQRLLDVRERPRLGLRRRGRGQRGAMTRTASRPTP